MCRLSAMWVKGNEISLCYRKNTIALRHTIRNFGLFWLGPEYCIVTRALDSVFPLDWSDLD